MKSSYHILFQGITNHHHDKSAYHLRKW